MSQSAPSRTPLLERIFSGHHDMLAALRSLRRSPAFVAIAVISLGLAIGLNTTTFALIDAVEHPYVAYDRPAELFKVGEEKTAKLIRLNAKDKKISLSFRQAQMDIQKQEYQRYVDSQGDRMTLGDLMRDQLKKIQPPKRQAEKKEEKTDD